MRFALIKNGRVVTVVESATTPQPNALFDTAEEYGPQHEPAPEVPDYGTKLSKFAFRQRFTFPERVTIETAAEGSATIRVFLKDMELAQFIDLSRGDVLVGLRLLEAQGILGAGRANEIISAPVQSHERP